MKLKYSAKAHGYWLDGKRCKSPSAIAKVPDDSSALDKWRRRQTAIGLAMRPELLTEVAASIEDKQALDAICERAMDHAGASSGRNWGSAVHLIIERDIAGATILETPETARVREQWNRLLADHHLEVVRAEAVIVHPERMIAGRFDQVTRCTVTGEQFVMDVKTGASAHEFLQAHAVQLWLYASAPLMGVGPQGDVDFEIVDFADMLPVSQSVAFVAHLPQDGEPSIIPVDIAAGGDCFRDVIQPTWAWRSRKDLRADWKPASSASPATVTTDATRDNLLRRCRKVAEMSPAGAEWLRAELVARSLNVKAATPAEFPLIVEVLERAETYVSAPFDPLPVPPVERMDTPMDTPPVLSMVPDEGPTVADGDPLFAEMKAAYGALDAAGRSWVGQVVTESIQAGRSLHMQEARTLRRVRVALGLALLAADGDDDGALRALVHLATGVDAVLFPSVPLGAAVSIMSAAEADVFVGAVRLLAAGMLEASVDGDGHVRLGVAA